MLNRIIRFSLQNRLLVLVASVLLLVAGTYRAIHAEVDVFPDLNAPTVVVMTEANGMAAEEVEQLNHLITDIHKDFNLTILLIEHHMDMVMAICPHIVCMNFGAKIAEGTPDEIQNHPEVLKAYLGEEE